MMVAAHFDDRENDRFPSDDARAELEAALQPFVRGSGREADETPVCAALRRLADEAHARHLHGEHLLVAFKRIWNELSDVRALRDAGERQRLLDRLVTLCIDAYYRRG